MAGIDPRQDVLVNAADLAHVIYECECVPPCEQFLRLSAIVVNVGGRDASADTPPNPTPNCGCPTGLPCYIHNDALWSDTSS